MPIINWEVNNLYTLQCSFNLPCGLADANFFGFRSSVTATASPNRIQDFVSEVVKHIQFLYIPGVWGPFLGPFPAVGLHPSCAGGNIIFPFCCLVLSEKKSSPMKGVVLPGDKERSLGLEGPKPWKVHPGLLCLYDTCKSQTDAAGS